MGAKPMADVFLSYKREDRPIADRMVAALQADGFSVWWDQRIQPAEQWDAEIEAAIKSAKAVVVVWTPRSAQSQWVRTEAEYAKGANKLAPVMAEPCELPMSFLLVQSVDLCRWEGSRSDSQWMRLQAWLRDLVTPGAFAAAEATVPERSADWRVAYGAFRNDPVFDGKTITRTAPAGTLFKDRADMPLLRVLPGGQFRMGSEETDPDGAAHERPQHQVGVAGPIGVGVFTVTVADWDALAPAGRRLGAASRPDLPITKVSYRDAMDWLGWASAASGEAYRLLSEAEWEYACRAGSAGPYSFSGPLDSARAHFSARSLMPVGNFPANAFGLFDMHGNVREWVADLWHDNYNSAPSDAIAWTVGHGGLRVVRGGAYLDGPKMLRSAARGRAEASERCDFIGFRVAREIR